MHCSLRIHLEQGKASLFLDIIGKVDIGKTTELDIAPGRAAYVPTGGMIPKRADGMAMIEYVEHWMNIRLQYMIQYPPVSF